MERTDQLGCSVDWVLWAACVASGFELYLREVNVILSDVKRFCQILWELTLFALNFEQKPVVLMLDSVSGFSEADGSMKRTVITPGE